VAELVAEAAGAGAAVLLSSHEPDLAVPLADRVAVMAGGLIAEEARGGRRPLKAVGSGDADVA
jgi:ABC-type uncharacterized transport system ATPase subunit